MKSLIALALALMSSTAFANFQGFNGTQNLGLFTGIQCSSSFTCAKQGARMTLSLATTPPNAQIRNNFSTIWTPMTPSSGTLVTPNATTVYLTQIEIPGARTFTGLQILNGTTTGTNKYIVALYYDTGALIASSAVAGVTTGTASSLQKIPFTAPVTVPSPRTIWAAVWVNGATDNFYALPAMAALTGLAGSVSGQTFGTVPATLTMPTTFTAGVGPIIGTY